MTTHRIVKLITIKITWIVISLLLCFMMNAQKELNTDVKEEMQNNNENLENVRFFKVAEELPRFPGCEDLKSKDEKNDCARKKLMDYVYENLKYPEEAREKGIQGIVVVRFYIDTLGKMQNIELLRDIGGGTGQAALDVCNKMNEEGIRWVPGKSKGKLVNVNFNLPVRFQLPSEEEN